MMLTDLMDPWALNGMVNEGYVRVQHHPMDHRLIILNYTEKAQFAREWNPVTEQCRGLVAQVDPGGDAHVVARPWPKFFNYGEINVSLKPEDAPLWDASVTVQDKMDGSLGILYCDPEGQWSIATRGSFESEQALHATQVYRERYEDYWAPRPGFTYLFEIIYPENRIVLDYGDLDDLVLLDVIHTETGVSFLAGQMIPTTHGWPGQITTIFPETSLFRALQRADRKNAEGVVVTWLGFDGPSMKLKIKQDDYVALHKIVTGLNERVVWEALAAGTLRDLMTSVPDEFHVWTETVALGLQEAHDVLQGRAHAAYHEILGYMRHDGPDSLSWGSDERKAFAGLAREFEHPALLFQLLDGRDISPAIWKTLKPKGVTAQAKQTSEDTA